MRTDVHQLLARSCNGPLAIVVVLVILLILVVFWPRRSRRGRPTERKR